MENKIQERKFGLPSTGRMERVPIDKELLEGQQVDVKIGNDIFTYRKLFGKLIRIQWSNA